MTQEEKETVLSNIGSIPAADLFHKYIAEEFISLAEMMQTGNLEAAKRRDIQNMIEATATQKAVAKQAALIQEEEDWSDAKGINTEESFSNYLKKYPVAKYLTEAISKLNDLKGKEKEKRKLLNRISQNTNDFTPGMINNHINKGDLTHSDLMDVGVPQNVVNSLINFNAANLRTGSVPSEIEAGWTEVYFWGIPGSGKTCALAGVLSQAHSTGLMEAQGGTGYDYMNQLKNIFRGGMGVLPPATSTEVTQYLPFHLTDKNKKQHPVALIELSGEIFECFYKKNSNHPLPSTSHENTFNTLHSFLKGTNKKVHFFVIDLSKDPMQRDDIGMCQDDYLTAAQQYFSQNEVFKKSTDAIYIVATKSDLFDCSESERTEKATSFLKQNYPSFVEGLKRVCEKNGINDNGKLHVIPFSLGEVYFNKICQFNSNSSGKIVEVLQNKTAKLDKKGFFTKLLNS